MSGESLPASADVVVVGGGIMGTSATYFLSQRADVDVVLVERDGIASGSTGDSSAILRHHYGSHEIYSRMAWRSHEFYRSFEDRTGEPIAYDRSPMVQFATAETRSHVAAGYEVLQNLDIPVTRYGGEELSAVFPLIDTGPFDFAVSDDDAGYSDGTDAAGGFARAAQRAGATVVTGVRATGVRTADGSVTGVETDAGTVDCDAVVVATGPWTAEFVADLGVDIPLEVTREQVLVLDPPADVDVADLPTSGANDGWYLRPDFGGGVLLATHHTDDTVDPDRYRETPDEETILELLDGLEAFAPSLADAGIKGRYCGVYTSTPDHDFVIDQVGPSGCVVACGFSGHGFKHGPVVGQILRDLALEGETDVVDVDHFSLDRFAEDPAGHGADDEEVT